MFTKMSFVHLHCHSEYSLLDGANRIEDLIRRAQEFEQPALAITDHGNLHAAWEFQEKAKKAGVKPIIGCEMYVAKTNRHDRDPASGRPHHLIVLCENEKGYQNLVKLVSKGYLEGFYYKPRIDYELLQKHSRGLIALSACLKGPVTEAVVHEKYDQARENAAKQSAATHGPRAPLWVAAKL
jgi:DNA polymerase-3 subunit alpha